MGLLELRHWNNLVVLSTKNLHITDSNFQWLFVLRFLYYMHVHYPWKMHRQQGGHYFPDLWYVNRPLNVCVNCCFHTKWGFEFFLSLVLEAAGSISPQLLGSRPFWRDYHLYTLFLWSLQHPTSHNYRCANVSQVQWKSIRGKMDIWGSQLLNGAGGVRINQQLLDNKHSRAIHHFGPIKI